MFNSNPDRTLRKTATLTRRMLAFLMTACILLPLMSPVTARAADEAMTAQSSAVQNEAMTSDGALLTDEPLVADDCNILQYVDEEAFNRADHLMRLPELEDLNTYVFANRDGSRSVYFMDENVKFIDANGKITEKDISLIAKTGGYGVARNDVELLLPTLPDSGIDVGYAGYSVKLIPQGGGDPVGQKIDNSIVYEGYYGANTSLKYTPILSGVKEDIVLDAYTGNVSYTFLLETDGLTLYSDGEGCYLSETADGEKRFRLGEVVVYDAMGKPSMGSMSVETVEAGKRYRLTVAADNAFLTDPDTVYPVTIDPTITVSDTESLTGQIEDAPIYEGYPTRCYGNYIYNRVGTASEAYARGRTVVRLTGLNDSEVYKSLSAGQIVSVTFNVVEASGGTTQTAYAYPLVNETWTETTVTWNNAGSYSTTVRGEGTLTPRRASAIDITELVKSWKNGTHSAAAGFVVIGADETVNKSFFSSEYSVIESRPYVELTYTPNVSLNYTELSMIVGETKTLTATTVPDGLDVVWSTSAPDIATVDETGVVTAIALGDAIITASFEGVEIATCAVHVVP